MLEQIKRAAVLLAVGGGVAFSSGAWGVPSWGGFDGSATIPIASEYFGAADGRVVEARTNDPARVSVETDGRRGDTITMGNEANLTYSLTGATFAESVSLSQFVSEGDNLSLSLLEGGQEGDSEVTVRIAVVGGDLVAFGTGSGYILFTLPDLRVTPAVLNPMDDPPVLGAAIAASVEVVRRIGVPFPEGTIVNANPEEPFRRLYTIAPALAISLDAGSAGQVDLMDRKVLTEGVADDTPAGSLNLGALKAASAGNGVEILGEDGDVVAVDGLGAAGLQGMLVVTASGDFQTDDKVMLGEVELTRSEDGGGFSGGVAIADAAGMAGLLITYVPGGVDDLLPTTFNTTVAVQYDDELNASGPVEGQQAAATINYEGISLAAYAHGIVKAGGEAVTYLRVACPGATDCSVFASCRDQSGASHFGELGVVAAGGLEVYDSNEIGEALDGGWEMGRGRCDLLSDGVLEVQNMLNQGSANVNNSLVTNGAGVLTRTQ